MAGNGNGGGTSVTIVVPPSSVHPNPPATPAVVVTHPRPHLPFTGFDVASALLMAALLLALGALLLVRGHHRPTPHTRRS